MGITDKKAQIIRRQDKSIQFIGITYVVLSLLMLAVSGVIRNKRKASVVHHYEKQDLTIGSI
jgi:hypothetical protein